ncbi:MAG: hypothetical protein WCI73_01625 [Phycisphaerae bacterium]
MSLSRIVFWMVLIGMTLGRVPMTRAAGAEWKVLIHPNNSFQFNILAGEKAVVTAGTTGWGPNWSWLALESNQKATADELSISTPMAIGGQKPTISLQVKTHGPRQAVFDYTLNTDQDVPVTQIVATVGVPTDGKGQAVLTRSDGTDKTTDLPMNPSEFGLVKKISLTGPAWNGPLELTLDPPLEVNGHGDLRLCLAATSIKAGATKARITWSFPAEVTTLLKASDVLKYAPTLPTPDWFAFQPKGDRGPSAIGFDSWLDKPAGKHGGVRLKGDRFVFADDTPIKFWGTNIQYGANAPTKADAEFTAARFAKFGVNAVRMHKFSNAGWEGIGDENDSTRMNPGGLDRLDYFASQLAKNGVYYGWSHSFQFKIRPDDKSRLSGFDELMKKGGNTYAVINWAEDVQDLLIDMVVNLLRHKNPYTGHTYAQDPALSYIELQNEDDIFFYTSGPAYHDFPTYRKLLETRFAQWLKTKYGTQEILAAAWAGALKSGEQIAAANLVVESSPWQMGDGGLAKCRGGARQRLLDNAAFLHDTQNQFYGKFVKAIRNAGYQGPLVGSPWQAPAMLPHYYNLRSDDLVGYIDRHNYFGEGFHDTMLPTPGGGYLSSGLQQVANKPFGISEWIHVYPSLYSAEGPVLMAAYGMGLQGWGASYEFASSSARSNPASALVGNLPWGVWNADAPTQLGQYPILARMIHRGDVTTAPIISTRRISPQDLEKGEFNFSDTVQQQGDIKTFTGSVSAATLAVGRVVVEFVDKTAPSTFPDMSKYTQGTVISSVTGQLKWDTAGGGLVTINTPGTQGYVGFAQGQELILGNVIIAPVTTYASILITAAGPKATLANGQRLLISAVARNANQGFRINRLDNRTIVENGTAPIMLEPVKANITITQRKIAQVNILDQDGNASGKTIPVINGKFTINSSQDHTIYYEIVMEP